MSAETPSEHASTPEGGAGEKERDLFGRVPKGRRDWSHRRGEPRVFALLWTLYLMLATLVMFASLSASPSVTPEVYRPAARTLLLLVMVGVTLLWPMTRLSQVSPHGGIVSGVLKDLVVVLLPVQALVWPHAMGVLSDWPLGVVAAMSASIGAWALIVGGTLTIALGTMEREGRGVARAAWMGVFVVLIGGAPLWLLLRGELGGGVGGETRVGWMLSPLTSVMEITRDRAWSGHSAWVGAGHWRALAWVTGLGGVLLAMGWVWTLARRGESA